MDKRHGDHHYINVKYGYYVLGLSLIHLVVLYFFYRRQITRLSHQKTPASLPVWLQIAAWCLLIFASIAYLFGDFVEHSSIILKRLGRIGYALVPLNIILALRPNLVNYLNLILLHKWISRLIIFVTLIHSIGYMVRWLILGQFYKLFRWLNFLGFVLFVAFTVLGVVSIKYMRTKNYRLFYVIHNVTIGLLVVLINFHARPDVDIITIVSVVLLVYQIYFKFNYFSVDITKTLDYGNLSLVEFSTPNNYPKLLPGSHLRFSSVSNYLWPSHPFTVIHKSDTILLLVVSNKGKFVPIVDSQYCITYPYNSFLYLSQYMDNNIPISMVVGGSGISFALSIITYYPNYQFELIWCIRSVNDMALLDHFDVDSCNIKVFVTDTDNLVNSYEMSEMNHKYSVTHGRPELGSVMTSPGLVLACGPQGLIEDCERYSREQKLPFIKEYYRM